MIYVNGHKLNVNNQILYFESKIKKILSLKKVLIILLQENISANKCMQSNLLSYSVDGLKLWETQLPPKKHLKDYFLFKRKKFFNDIGIDSNGNFYAENSQSLYYINLATGTIQ